ncbi:MAG: hypothetical protein MUF21_10165 [Gemmatimonadaceae bacterium]|nr:hypothetical protein [Gemmatimonadaceae bacterium]
MLGLLGAGRLDAQPTPCTIAGGGTASFSFSDTVAASVATTYCGCAARLESTAIVVAPAGWLQRQAPPAPPSWWRPSREGGGGTLGPIWIQHDITTDTIIVDGIARALGGDNVLLLRVEAPDAPPRVVGSVRVDGRVPSDVGSCRGEAHSHAEFDAFTEAMKAVLRRNHSVRRHVRG